VDPTNRNTALASALAEELGRCGVRHAVISPGSRSSPLALALWREAAIDAEVVLDERSAGFVAIGAALASRRPAVVLCTSGSAAANLHPAVVEADEAGVPLIVLTADRPPELRAIGAGQTIDQLKLYGAAVRWFCEVGTHEADDDGLLHFRSIACRAFAVARGEPRPGPVHLNVPWREPLAPVPAEVPVSARSELALKGRDPAPLTAVTPPARGAGSRLLDRLAERIAGTERGVIVAGRQYDPGLAPAVAALAAASGYPILPEPTSQLRLGDHDRSRVVWAYDAIARARPAPLAPDLVLRFGDMPTSKSLRTWISDHEPEQIVVAPHGWYEPTRRATEIVRADPAAVAAGLGSRLGSGGAAGAAVHWTARWLRAGELAAGAIEAALSSAEPSEPGLQRRLADVYDDDDLVYTASSMPIRDQEAFLPSGPAAVTFLCNRGANGIDGLVSSGAGAAIASGRPTWIVTGDLGLVHDAAGLAAIAAASAPVRVVVANNDGGGIFDFLPQAEIVAREEFEPLFATPSNVEPGRLAAAHGVPHRLLESLDQLEAASAAGTGVIEMRTGRRANVELHRRIADRVASELARLDGS
jgi:2-succinyl-5-enolpyruvyl-6-hydroxy-3-cyclohexene-1-carboxylate synthase